MTRQAGLRGCRPAAHPELYPRLEDHLVAPLPAPVYPIDVSGGVTTWGMLGNGPDPTLTVHGGNPVGNCGFAAMVHKTMADAARAAIAYDEPSTNVTVSAYLDYDGGADNGVDAGQMMADWFTGRIPDHLMEQDAAFFSVSEANADAAMQAFGALMVAVNLTDDADQLFNAGQPWTVANGQRPDPNDGHFIVKVKATGNADVYVTWGAEQAATVDWSRACCQNLYAVVTADQATRLGINLAAALAQIRALGGQAEPDPTPVTPVTKPVTKRRCWRDLWAWITGAPAAPS